MSDWAVGDLAVCLNSGWIDCGAGVRARPRNDLVKARAYRVIGIVSAGRQWNNEPALKLEGVAWRAAQQRFRKILPDKHESCESEFVDLLKRSKRKVSA